MLRKIIGFQRDLEEPEQWLAKLDCHHFQHIRHKPPWQSRPWTQSEKGRCSMLGHELNCVKCDNSEVADW